MNNRKNRGLSGLTLLVFVAVLFAALWFTNQIDQREKVITYQEFTQLAGGGDIDTVEVIQNKNVPTGRFGDCNEIRCGRCREEDFVCLRCQ